MSRKILAYYQPHERIEGSVMRRLSVLLVCLVVAVVAVRADGPGDNQADKVRPIPPKGIGLKVADVVALAQPVNDLGREIDDLARKLKDEPELLDLLPDVEIYYLAVRHAAVNDEFFAP